jgi:hypothetical protein
MQRLRLLSAQVAANNRACAELRRQTLGMYGMQAGLSSLLLSPGRVPSSLALSSTLGTLPATGSLPYDAALVQRLLERQRQGGPMTSGF